jgi:hypothetical protein
VQHFAEHTERDINRHTDFVDAVPSRSAAYYYSLEEASLYILFNYRITDEFPVFIVAAGAATLLHTCCNGVHMHRWNGATIRRANKERACSLLKKNEKNAD